MSPRMAVLVGALRGDKPAMRLSVIFSREKRKGKNKRLLLWTRKGAEKISKFIDIFFVW